MVVGNARSRLTIQQELEEGLKLTGEMITLEGQEGPTAVFMPGASSQFLYPVLHSAGGFAFA